MHNHRKDNPCWLVEPEAKPRSHGVPLKALPSLQMLTHILFCRTHHNQMVSPHLSSSSLPVPPALSECRSKAALHSGLIFLSGSSPTQLHSPCLAPSRVLGPRELWGRGLPLYLPTGYSENMPRPALGLPWAGREAVPAAPVSTAATSVHGLLPSHRCLPLSHPPQGYLLPEPGGSPHCLPRIPHQPCPLWPWAHVSPV